MSSIYIQEPPTLGKVLLETSVGDIDVELFAREAPKAVRNFVQLSLEGYYDNTIFHRIVKGFIAQGGDPTGTGEGGESIYGEPFKDEFHSRLRFVRRGLVAMANGGKDDNGSQFFFTFAPAPELQNKHTIFGKVTGDTLFNMLKLEDTLVDQNDRPKYPPTINSVKILNNPFNDIVPRVTKEDGELSEKKRDPKSKSKAVKNFSLLSFGDEAEEDEEEVNKITKDYEGKAKSSHDLTDDPELSSITAAEAEEGKKRERESDDEENKEEVKLSTEEEVERIRKKLKKDKQDFLKKSTPAESTDTEKTEAIRKEYKQLKKDMAKSKKLAEMPEAVKEFKESVDKFGELRTKKIKKGSDREQETLALLARFQEKLQSVKEKVEESKEEENVEDEESWLKHTLNFEKKESKVKDANMRDEDTYEIFDPRNPINQRRREASKHTMKKR